MKAMVIDQYGPPEVLHASEVRAQELGEHDVLVRNFATSVNPVDWKVRKGFLAERMPLEFPAILGWDSAGIIEQVGSNVSAFHVGDKIFSRPATERPGTYSDYVVVSDNLLAPKPAALTFLEAATIPLAGLTAWEALVEIAHLQKGQRVLVHGGAGGVGGYAIQIAKAFGAFAASTAREPNRAYLRKLGADEVWDYESGPFEQGLHGFDVVLDTMGGEVQNRSFEVLKAGGVLVSIAQPPDQDRAQAAHVQAHWFFLQPDGAKLRALGDLFERGLVHPIVGEVFPLDRIGDAHRLSETGHARGKIAIAVDPVHAVER